MPQQRGVQCGGSCGVGVGEQQAAVLMTWAQAGVCCQQLLLVPWQGMQKPASEQHLRYGMRTDPCLKFDQIAAGLHIQTGRLP